MKKIKIHIRNNHWKEGFLPCDLEGEKHSTITKEEFEKGLSHYPENCHRVVELRQNHRLDGRRNV